MGGDVRWWVVWVSEGSGQKQTGASGARLLLTAGVVHAIKFKLLAYEASGLFTDWSASIAWLQVHLLGRRNGRDRMFENGLHGLIVATQQNHILIKRLDFSDQLYSVDQEYGTVHMLLAECVEELVLQVYALAHGVGSSVRILVVSCAPMISRDASARVYHGLIFRNRFPF
jgi:hypothetical protein